MSISGILQNINTKALSIIGIIVTITSTIVSVLALTGPYFIVGIIFAVVAIFAAILLLYGGVRKYETKKRKRDIDLDLNDFQNYENEPFYIPANIRDLQSDEPNLIRPFFEYFWEIINRKQVESRHICLLGETGSGKTDALVHLYLKYINEYCTQPSAIPNIRLFSMKMGYPKLLKTIKSEIPQKKRRKTILLLDALDECKEARDSLANTPDNNPTLFMKRLAQDTKDFAWVLVSCRNQFFQSEAFYPSETGVEIGKSKSAPHWHNLHLELFNEAQMENYLIQHFDPSNPDSLYEDTKKIASKYKEIFQRPLLLDNIDIVLKEYHNPQEPLTIKKVYDAIILFWINKETKYDASKTKEVLSNSLCVAEYMYQNKLMYLDEGHYKKMCEEYEIDDPDNLFRINSLLKSDKEGYCFVHQSFYEHLLAYCFFLNPNVIDSVQGLFDSTLVTFEEILDEHSQAKGGNAFLKILGKDIVPDETLAIGLYNMGRRSCVFCYFSKAERFYTEALKMFKDLAENDQDSFISDVALTLTGLAALHSMTNHPNIAKTEFQEALKIYRELAKKNPDTYLPIVALNLSNMGYLYNNIGQYHMAEKECQEALRIYRQLADEHPDTYLTNIVTTLYNLASSHQYSNHYDDAEREIREALKINRGLAEMNPDVYLPDVAKNLSNLGSLLIELHRNNEAETELQEALGIHRQLARKAPKVHLPAVATTLNNLGTLHRYTNRNEEAEKEHLEALKICRMLADTNPDAYLPYVAETLHNLAAVHLFTHCEDAADKEFNEALEIKRKFAEKTPDYLPKLANTLNGLALLHHKTNHYSDAKMEYDEALRIQRQMAEKHPDAYLPDVATTLFNLALMYQEKGQLQEAEDAVQESLKIRQQMAELSHEAFDRDVKEAQGLLSDIQSIKSAWSLS